MASRAVSILASADAIDFSPEALIPDGTALGYAAPGAFLLWLARAKAGQVCLYARASMLSAREPIGATVRMVADGGQVELWQSRPHALMPFNYFARRTVKVLLAPAPVSPARKRAMLSDMQSRLLEHLSDLADAGSPHGSNAHLALALGMGSRAAVASALNVLERSGLIRRSQDAVFTRVIEIVETGGKTRGHR